MGPWYGLAAEAAMARSVVWWTMALVACTAAPEGGGPGGDDTGTAPDDGWPNHRFDSGTLAGCSTDLAWQRWTWDGEGPAEATIVLTHGLTEYTDKYHHVVRELEGRPWDVIAWDQFGHGRSGGTRAHAVDFEAQHVCDLDALLADVADPALPVGHLAHSTGGLVVARWLETHPGQAFAAVMGSPLLGLRVDGFTVEGACNQAQLFVDGGQGEEWTNPNWDGHPSCEDNVVTHDCEQYALFEDDPLTLIGPPTFGWLDAACDMTAIVQADVALVTEPVLILQAEEDLVVDAAAMDPWCAAVTSEGGCDLVVEPGTYHELFMEVDRAAYVAEAADFLEAHLP